MENATIVFRADGTGWTYWARDGGAFYVDRLRWRTNGDGGLELRIHQTLSGTWTVRDDAIQRHSVDNRSAHTTNLILTYMIMAGHNVFGAPATLLRLDRSVRLGAIGKRFALKRDTQVEDPTIGARQ
ncbi:MAG TPA: hypothetical protein VE465_07900 [Streptosporangiaceae bacterium]|nr:hypothetical protein [Streptosporangiaceae bacterium]